MKTISLESQKPLHKYDLYLAVRIERMTDQERVEFFTYNNIEIDGKIYYLPEIKGEVCQ